MGGKLGRNEGHRVWVDILTTYEPLALHVNGLDPFKVCHKVQVAWKSREEYMGRGEV